MQTKRALVLCFAAFPFLSLSVLAGGREFGRVPRPLTAMESLAEDAYDHALAGQPDRVGTDARGVDGKWRLFRAQAARDGARSADLAEIDTAVADLLHRATGGSAEQVGLARAANRISGVMDELFGLYRPPVPPALNELDFLGREVVLNAMEAKFHEAADDVMSIRSTWLTMKDAVLAAGGRTDADSFEASLAAIDQAIAAENGVQLIARANANLELVDRLEKLFSR